MTASPNRSAASIKARLLSVSKATNEEFQRTLERYAVERFLVRIVGSRYRDQFVLKGATLYTVWTGQPHRPTRDLDLLGQITPDEEMIASAVREICDTEVDADGLVYDAASVEASKIREDKRYGGIRVMLNAYIGKARIRVQIDVGFGDVVTPGPIVVRLPSIFADLPAASIRAYNLETVVAEKIEAMIALGATNSRMKDFYETWVFAARFEFEGNILVRAITNTFRRRGTPIPTEVPVVLTAEFGEKPTSKGYWIGFLRTIEALKEAPEFTVMTNEIAKFAMPLLAAVEAKSDFDQRWPPGGPWSEA